MFDWFRRLFRPTPTATPTRATAADSTPRRLLQAGRQTQPANALGAFGWQSVPRRAVHATDLSTVDVRSYSAQQLLDILADVSPEVSLALWNVLRLAGGAYTLTAMRPDGSEPDERAQTALDELVGRINRRHGGLESLIDQWHLTYFLQGAAAAELVLVKSLRDIDDVVAVQPYTIEFRRDSQQIARPYCQDATGQWKPLNEHLFWYVALDSPPDDPYGRAPAAPAIAEVMFGVQLLVDLKRAVHTNAWGRLDVAVMHEALTNAAPANIRNDGNALATWMNARLAEIQTAYNDLRPDDTFIHFDLVKVGAVDSSGKTLQIAPLIRVLELRIIRALKQLPVLMGSNEGTTETHGTVQFEIYAAGIRALRSKSDFLVEQILTQALNVMGVQSAVEMEWDDLRTTDRLADAQAEELEIANEANKREQGWQSNEEAAMAVVGHEPVGEPTAPPPTAPTGGQRMAGHELWPAESAVRADAPIGVVDMTAAERRVLREGQVAYREYFERLGQAFPARRIAEQVVAGQPRGRERHSHGAAQAQARADEDDEDPAALLGRVQKLVDEWFSSEPGRKMTDELHAAVEEHYIRAWNVEGAEALQRIGIGGSFRLRNETVLERIRTGAAERVGGIDDTTRGRLAGTISASFRAGNGVDGIGRDIRREFTDMSKTRARLIAHTETGNAMGEASHETYERNGVEKRSWLTVGDSRVSAECRANAAQGAVPIKEPFSSGAMHPLQHQNCRCVERPSIPASWTAPVAPWRGGPMPYEPVGTVAEAEAWGRANYPHITFDFQGAHIDTVNPVMRQFYKLSEEYPEVAARLERVGSGPSGEAYQQFIEVPEALATTSPSGREIALNPAFYGDPARLRTTLAKAEKLRFLGKGTATPEGIFSHEFGHATERWLIESGKETQRAVSGFEVRATGAKQISKYAASTIGEAWAEGFAAIQHLPDAAASLPYVKKQQALINDLVKKLREAAK